jgi:hypothetical protein
MVNGPLSHGTALEQQAASGVGCPVLAVGPPSGAEHVALLVDLRGFRWLRRWDDLFDEGVAAIFGINGAEAELVALCFRAMTYTTAEVARWLAERCFVPLHLVSISGGNRPV